MLNRRTRPISPKPIREQLVAEARVLPAHALFQGTRMLVIEHESESAVSPWKRLLLSTTTTNQDHPTLEIPLTKLAPEAPHTEAKYRTAQYRDCRY